MENEEEKTKENKEEGQPKSFDEYCALVVSRAQLLLQVVPCKKQDLKDNTNSLSQLAAKWRSVLPPPTLEPLLARWKTVDVSNDKWRGVISVLRTQKALKQTDSSENDQSDEKTPEMQIMSACKNYIFDTDISPSRLRNLLIRRHCRAVSRKYGLEAFYSILDIMTGENFTALSSTSCVQALMWLRPGLRGVSKTTKHVVASAKNVRHHYLKGLEGCVSTIIDDVQASFLQLYTKLMEILKYATSSRIRDTQLAHVAMWNWGLDFENRDHEFLVRVGILSHLRNQFSLLVREQQQQQDDDDGDDEAFNKWIPWSYEYVKQALLAGKLTKRGLLTHMRGVPRSVVSSEWFARNGLDEAKQCYDNIESLLNLYATFLRYYVSMYAKRRQSPLSMKKRKRAKLDDNNEEDGAFATKIDNLDATTRLTRLSQIQFSSWTLFQLIATMCIGGAQGRRDEEYESRQRLANSAGVRINVQARRKVQEYLFYKSPLHTRKNENTKRYTYNRYPLHLRNQLL